MMDNIQYTDLSGIDIWIPVSLNNEVALQTPPIKLILWSMLNNVINLYEQTMVKHPDMI